MMQPGKEENFGLKGRRRKDGYYSRRISMIETAADEFARVSGQRIRGTNLWRALIAAIDAALAYSGSQRLANDPKRRHAIAVKAGKARQKAKRNKRRKLSEQVTPKSVLTPEVAPETPRSGGRE